MLNVLLQVTRAQIVPVGDANLVIAPKRRQWQIVRMR